MNAIIRPVKGTRDFYPPEMAGRVWLYQQMRQVSEQFGYQEYEGPILEPLDLYAAKSGEELVEKQSYVFQDRGGDKITLRPELTPTLARMVAQQQNQLTFPLRWWSFGPFWRYERPQKGRTREFFQWNIDLIGDPSPQADAELAAIAATFLKQVGLQPNEVQILVNDRELMDSALKTLGLTFEHRAAAFGLIDRRDKLTPEAWQTQASEAGLSPTQIDGLIALLENTGLWQQSDSLQQFFRAVEWFGVADYVRYSPTIIRGLQYYTGTVFEAWDTAGDFRALFGGGRYDNLVGAVGGRPVGAVGFAVGDLVISLLLQSLGKFPPYAGTPAEVFVTLFDEQHLEAALRLANELRAAGIKVASQYSPAKLGKQFKYASQIGARFAVVLGPDEIQRGQVAVKDLHTEEQTSLPRAELAGYLTRPNLT